MDADEALTRLGQLLYSDPKVQARPDWDRLVMVCRAEEGSVSLSGYTFTEDNAPSPVAPSPGRGTDDAVEELQRVMQEQSPARAAWIACLVHVTVAGELEVDFEYSDRRRWAFNPRDAQALPRELALLPAPGRD